MREIQLSQYESLKEIVESGHLKLFLMLSTPRTRSTALQIALSQATEIKGQISAPFSNQAYGLVSFHYENQALSPGKDIRTFESGCNKIYDAVNSLRSESDERIGLLVYEALSRLLKDEISKLLTLTRNVIVPIRDPLLQFSSFLVQYFHDYFSHDGSAYLKVSELFKLLSQLKHKSPEELDKVWSEHITKESIAKILKEDISKIVATDILIVLKQMNNFVVSELNIIWSNLGYCLTVLLTPQIRQSHQVIIVDGEMFMKDSKGIMQSICERLHINFKNEMISDWKKNSGNNFKSGHPTNDRLQGWSTPARESTGISKNNDSVDCVPRIEDFPEEFHPILKQAQLIYENCLARPELIQCKKQVFLPSFESEGGKKKRFKSISPSGSTEHLNNLKLSPAQLTGLVRNYYTRGSHKSETVKEEQSPPINNPSTRQNKR